MTTQQRTGRELKPIDEVRGALEKMGDQFKMVLPAHIPVERFQRVAITAIAQNPDLVQTERTTLYAECMKAAQDGLLPDGREAVLTVYKQKRGDSWTKVAKYMPMVWGIAKKVRNSGELATLTAQVVYTADQFDYWIDDTGEHLQHRPVFGDDRGEPRLVYAIAVTKNGDSYIEPMTIAQVNQVMKVSKSKDQQGNPVGPWKDWWEEMARKTAIRRLSKRLPMSTDKEEEIRRVIERDDDLYDLNRPPAAPPAIAQPPTPAADKPKPTSRPRRLQRVLDAADDTPPPETEAPPDEGNADNGEII